MKIPFLDLLQFKEPDNQLKYISPYAFIIEPHVCLLKNASIMTTYQVEYPDLESSSAQDVASIARMFNENIRTIAQTEGWAVFFEARREKTKDYPAGSFDNLAGWLVDQKRAENFRKFGEHFVSDYYITFVYQLPNDLESKATSFFYKKKKNQSPEKTILKSKKVWPEIEKEIEKFLDETDKAIYSMSSELWIRHLDASGLFSYIKSCVSLDRENLVYPENSFFFLDNYVCDRDIWTSMPLKVGDDYVPVIAIRDFPSQTYPAIFDGLNRSLIEYRWVTRFIPLSKETSLKTAKKYQNKFFAARKSAATLFTEMAANTEIDKVDQAAVALEAEASQMQEEITLGSYVLGYYTSSLLCWDKNLTKAREKSRELQQIVRSCGFGAKEERFNNFQAFCGMMAGNVYANIRRPLISSKNLSNIIPLSSAWEGQLYNDFTAETSGSSVPLCICSTSYGTPFFLNLNVRDVGHTFVFGPTGGGKSTFLALIMAQALKYENANVICIDKQLSSRALMVASGGTYIEPGKDEVAFQPLSELKTPGTCSQEEYNESLLWCAQFVEGLLAQQNIQVTPEMSKVITETLRLISQKSSKDLTTFQQYAAYQDPVTGENTISAGIDPYCSGGQFGSIFDAEKTTLGLSKIMAIEMGTLMRLSEKAVGPALMYIFRYLEKIWNVERGEKQPLTFLVLDEAWLYLQHPMFQDFIQEWLRTLRKKKVFCICATQEVEAAASSPLSATIAQQCVTKIYLRDKYATTEAMAESYRYFGLRDSEIISLSEAPPFSYYFKNANGSRMFSLDLDEFQLALIASDHEVLDKVEKLYGRNTTRQLAFELLDMTKEKYREIGKNPDSLDYERFREILLEYQE